MIKFDVRTNATELEKNLKLQGCPSDLQDKAKEVVTEYWDFFCEDGFLQPIRGFLVQIDTGKHPPICCKPPRYGPRESEVMQNLVERLDENGAVEEEAGPWGGLVVLVAKPHQENVPWHKYHWGLFVSYQKLNQFTRPFTFTVPRCDDAVQYINTEANYFIAVDMYSGYWQVVTE